MDMQCWLERAQAGTKRGGLIEGRIHDLEPTTARVKRRYEGLAARLCSNETLERERTQQINAAHEELRHWRRSAWP
jgi:hypothetical protein